MDLTQDEVIELLKLLDAVPVGRFTLRTGDLTLEVTRGGEGFLPSGEKEPLSSPVESVPDPEARSAAPVGSGTEPVPAGPASPVAIPEGLLPIKAPLLGIFYRRPAPGAPTYVSEGSPVEEETTVALIEVMKMFNPVRAGVKGRIHQVCVENGELVEYGQTLFLVSQSED
jgi:acetyl-CoA carboxylase biotin carboxyl carrier protein